MHRTTKLTVPFCALLGICLAASAIAQTHPSAAPAEMVENPAFKYWAQYKPGTSSTMKGTTEAAGQKMETQTVTKLVDAADDHVTLEFTQTMNANGQTQSTPPQKVELKKMVAKADMTQPGKGFDPDLLKNATEESVTVPAGTFKAKVIEFTKQQGGMTMKIKTWFSEEVPGGQVKSEIVGEGAMKVNISAELASFDKK